MEGQMTIFDFLETIKPQAETVQAGQWVKCHGKRVKFEDIQPGKYYIADYSSAYMDSFKVLYVKRKFDDVVQAVDSPAGINKPWACGNSFSCQTREEWINGSERHCQWFYELAEGQIGA